MAPEYCNRDVVRQKEMGKAGEALQEPSALVECFHSSVFSMKPRGVSQVKLVAVRGS